VSFYHLNHPIKKLWLTIIEPMDRWLLLLISLIYLLSLLVLYSADQQHFGRLTDKLFYSVLAFGFMWLIARSSPQFIMQFVPFLYFFSVGLLVAVDFFGVIVNGAQRWLDLQIVSIQPSEIMKSILPMMIAWYLYRIEEARRWYHYLLAIVMIIVPSFLVLKQPDFGTACLIILSGLFVLFFAGISWKAIAGGLGVLLGSLPILWQYGLLDYQKQRILSLLTPSQNLLGAGYHHHQSMIAIGSGGFLGKGWGQGTQTYLDYIPEGSTDFIFAVYSEEFGLVGNMILLALYLAIILRGFKIAAYAPTLYSQLLAATITLCFFLYIFVNICMVTGIFPVVGVPLPLMSYGGTATLMILMGQGVLMSIANQKR
jgi:rod shape determining protein RodA